MLLQVLLSCSHVFHKQCMASFERFARNKCCPLCRVQWYEKKIIQDGAVAYRNKCAVRCGHDSSNRIGVSLQILLLSLDGHTRSLPNAVVSPPCVV